jgi:hypothetical protein
MIDFQAGKDFLVAVQHEYQKGEPIRVDTSRGPLVGTVEDRISREDYLEVWAFRGYDADGMSLHPRFYYRCVKLSDIGGASQLDPQTEVGEQENGL